MTRPVRAVIPRRAGGCYLLQHGRGHEVFVGLHGWSGSHQSFEPLAQRLPETARLLAFDLPGVGLSPAPGVWSNAALVEPLEAALGELNLPALTVIGVCGGVGPALELARRRPDLVKRLVLVDPFTFVPWYLRLFTTQPLGAFFYWWTFANPVGRRLTDGALAGRRAEGTSLTEGFGHVRHDHNRGQLRAFCDAAARPLREYAAFGGAMDVLYGERTFRAVHRSVTQLQETFRSVRVWKIPGAGHLPMHEAPDRVAAAVFETPGSGGETAPPARLSGGETAPPARLWASGSSSSEAGGAS